MATVVTQVWRTDATGHERLADLAARYRLTAETASPVAPSRDGGRSVFAQNAARRSLGKGAVKVE